VLHAEAYADGWCCVTADGPTTPWQKLVSVDDKDKVVVLTDNAKLQEADNKFEKGDKIWTTVKAGQYGQSVCPRRVW
jgi:hypothetical protein